MIDLSSYKRILSARGNTNGQAKKYHADLATEVTWNNDVQSKVAYIYDYYHDDQPDLASHMTYNGSTTKTAIDIKFIVNTYASLAKDDVAFHIMFKPSQPVEFSESDELYYYQTDYVDRYQSRFPIGMFIDIPNEKGVYEKWMIVSAERGNQFTKYFVLPCNYKLYWIEVDGNKRIKRSMWCIKRTQSSYNSGLWTDYIFTSTENQAKLWLPLNPLTEYFYYTSDAKMQRLLVGALTKHPTAWQISKIENAEPIGIQKLTLYQDFYNPTTDYVNLKTGEMYADYYDSSVEPVDESPQESISCKIIASSNSIKCGGSYRLLTALFFDKNGNDITSRYTDFIQLDSWSCSIDGEDFTSNALIGWKEQSDKNKIRIKFAKDTDYLTKVLSIKCTTKNGITGDIDLEIVPI